MVNQPQAPIKSKYNVSFGSLIQIPLVKQLGYLIALAVSVALGLYLYTSIGEPAYQPLDYAVTQQNLPSIVDTLNKAGIKYKISDQDGILFVPARDMQLARLKLSSAGIAKDDGFNFNYLNDQGGVGNSQFLENARYLRALEEDLAKTIGAIEGISSARVHVAIPQNNVFADENQKPTASIVVGMAPGLSADKDKVRAIIQIVASSVPGLDPKDVSITDQYGHYLSELFDQNSMFNAEQLAYQNRLQNYYEKRIESMVVPLTGNNKVNVRVYANLDFTQNEEANEVYDPAGKVVRSEETVNESSSSNGASGPPGALANTPPESDSEKAAASPTPTASGVGSGRSQSTKNYEIGKSVKYKRNNAAKVASLSVAIVVDNAVVMDPTTKKLVTKPLDKDMLAKIDSIVKASIGYDEKRGDKVTVVNSAFVPPPPEVLTSTPLWKQPWFWDCIKKSIGMILGFIFLLFMARYLRDHAKNFDLKKATGKYVYQEGGSAAIDTGSGMTPEMEELKQEQIHRLKELASRDPNRVSIVLKNWVGK